MIDVEKYPVDKPCTYNIKLLRSSLNNTTKLLVWWV